MLLSPKLLLLIQTKLEISYVLTTRNSTNSLRPLTLRLILVQTDSVLREILRLRVRVGKANADQIMGLGPNISMGVSVAILITSVLGARLPLRFF